MVTTTQRQATPSRKPRSRWRIRAASAVLIAVGALSLSATATPATADSLPHGGCLWDGAGYRVGATVYAGGWAFTCGTDSIGWPRWDRGSTRGHGSTVSSPGTGYPVGRFSPGAVQPGSDYNDYCVGSQLIEGPDDIYELREIGTSLLWRSIGSVSQWAFESPAARPAPTSRTSSMCTEGVLS
ncbi:hypothetical protein [Nocardia tengchongensis]|uniref:hypothetical protein n=1 Tax=Nocardia tengchongensis TaxID=2055889 RepID=UPI0036C9558F